MSAYPPDQRVGRGIVCEPELDHDAAVLPAVHEATASRKRKSGGDQAAADRAAGRGDEATAASECARTSTVQLGE